MFRTTSLSPFFRPYFLPNHLISVSPRPMNSFIHSSFPPCVDSIEDVALRSCRMCLVNTIIHNFLCACLMGSSAPFGFPNKFFREGGGGYSFRFSSIDSLFFKIFSSIYNFSPTLSLINMLRETLQSFHSSVPSFIKWIGRKGGQKSGSMNFGPKLFCQNLIVKWKRRVRFGTTGTADWFDMLSFHFT